MEEQEIGDIQAYLTDEICGCYNCQPWEGGEPIWIEHKSDLYDLLLYYDVKEGDMEEVLQGFSCPRCGNSLESPYAEVAVKTEYDRKVAKIFDDLENDEIKKKLVDFSTFLSRFPYLGALHPFGKEIFDCLTNAPKYNLIKEEWFRARLLNDESRTYNSHEMFAPDPNKVYIKEGRYNHTGQSFLYLSKDEKTAFIEVKQPKVNTCVIQKFVITDLKNILDLRFDYLDINTDANIVYLALIYNGHLNEIPNEKSSWKPEYFIPRYMADVARRLNYDGILYTGAVSLGLNLLIFDWQSSNIAINGDTLLYREEEHPLEIYKKKRNKK